MRNVSTVMRNAAKSDTYTTKIEFVQNGVTIPETGILQGSTSIKWQMCDSTEPAPGGVYVTQLNVTFLPGAWAVNKANPLIPVVSILVGSSWRSMELGRFYVSEAQVSKSGIAVKAYDQMGKLDKTYTYGSVAATPYTIVSLAATAAGLTLDTTQAEIESMPNGTRTITPVLDGSTAYTWRDMLSFLCKLLCAYATINASGHLEIVPFLGAAAVETFGPNDRLDGAAVSAFSSFYSGVSSAHVESGVVEYTASTTAQGTGNTWTIGENPYIQGAADARENIRKAIADYMGTKVWTPASFTVNSFPYVEIGDMLQLPDTYAGTVQSLAMAVSWTAHRGTTIDGYGSDPALASAQSRVNKNVAGLATKMASSGSLSINKAANAATVGAPVEKVISTARLISDRISYGLLMFSMAYTATGQIATADNVTTYSRTRATVNVYAGNDVDSMELINSFSDEVPDGRHTLSIVCPIPLTIGVAKYAMVSVDAKNGNVLINAGDAVATWMSTGAAGSSALEYLRTDSLGGMIFSVQYEGESLYYVIPTDAGGEMFELSPVRSDCDELYYYKDRLLYVTRAASNLNYRNKLIDSDFSYGDAPWSVGLVETLKVADIDASPWLLDTFYNANPRAVASGQTYTTRAANTRIAAMYLGVRLHQWSDGSSGFSKLDGYNNRLVFNCTALITLDITGSTSTGGWPFAFAELTSATTLHGLDAVFSQDGIGVAYEMFKNCKASWDSSHTTSWDVSSCVNMYGMFAGTGKQRYNLSGWDVSNVASVTNMFNGCTQLESVNLTGWNLAACNYATSTFDGCTSLETITGLGGLVKSSATNINNMFRNCSNLADISGASAWDTSAVVHASGLFAGCTMVASISALASWDTSAMQDTSLMFSGVRGIGSYSPLSNWDVSSVTDMNSMFEYNTSMQSAAFAASWDTSAVKFMGWMFNGCTRLSDISALANWSTAALSDQTAIPYSKHWAIRAMFSNCAALTSVSALSGWNVSRATSLQTTFYNCPALTSVAAIAGWNVSAVDNFYSAFDGCSALADASTLNAWTVQSGAYVRYAFDGVPLPHPSWA